MNRVAASYLFALDGRGPVRNGFVEYDDDGTILRTGVCEDIAAEPHFLVDCALVPGFVNTHCHVELSYMLGLFRRGTGMAGFIDQINALRDWAPQAERIEAVRMRMEQLWQRGVQAMADISNCPDSFAIKAASPMYTRTFLEVFGTKPEDCPPVMENVLALQREALSFGLDAAPTPHACYTMSPELLTASSAAGLASGYLSFHSEETPEEEEMMRNGSGPMWENRVRAGMSTPPVTGTSSLLYFLDCLEKAHPAPFDEHILLVHEVCMDAEGIAAVKAKLRHPFIALCPLSNIYIHNALPPVELLRESGLTLTVGTDSLSSNDDLDMVSELFCLQENFPMLSLEEMLGWACRNGAAFLGKEDVTGSLEAGKQPGIVCIDHVADGGLLTSASTSSRIR